MITVILYRPQTAGNIGAVARVMKNFGFSHLAVITPNCDMLDDVAIQRAKHAKNILGAAVCMHINDLAKYDLLIATTSKITTDYNIPRTPVTPRQLSEDLKEVRGNIGLLFGPEGVGLPTSLLRTADYTVHIPTSKAYAAMNLSHAVGIVLYEIAQLSLKDKLTGFPLAPSEDKKRILDSVKRILKKLDMPVKQKSVQNDLWPKALGKARLSKREAMALMGFFREVERKLK